MKHILLLFSFCSVFVLSSFAQNREDKVQALYVAYVTQQLKLTETEAQQFWPIHSTYDAEIKAVGTSLSELDRQQATLNIKKKYQDRFTRILGADRTNQFFRIDIEFRKKMVERLQKLRANGGGPMRRNSPAEN